jgi:hypothetical protein
VPLRMMFCEGSGTCRSFARSSIRMWCGAPRSAPTVRAWSPRVLTRPYSCAARRCVCRSLASELRGATRPFPPAPSIPTRLVPVACRHNLSSRRDRLRTGPGDAVASIIVAIGSELRCRRRVRTRSRHRAARPRVGPLRRAQPRRGGPPAGRREAPWPAGLTGGESTETAAAAAREGTAEQRTPGGRAEAERVRRGTPSVAAARTTRPRGRTRSRSSVPRGSRVDVGAPAPRNGYAQVRQG